MYVDLLTEEKLAARRAAEEAERRRRAALEATAYDFFPPGDTAAERARDLSGERSETLDFKGRRARVAERGGWFAFAMNVLPDQPMALVVDYWGGFTGSKTFDILVDGTPIATENISGKQDGAFIDVAYPIPPDLTRDKQRVEVKFSPHEGHRAGPVFGVRTIPR